jgi:hypothetical protein
MMTVARTGPLSPQPADDPPFARLIHELQELGFEQVAVSTPPGPVVYAATDSPALVAVNDQPGHQHTRVMVGVDPPYGRPNHGAHGADPSWQVTWTVGTPHVAQLIALYAALNTDPGAAIEAAAAAIGLASPITPARPRTVAG